MPLLELREVCIELDRRRAVSGVSLDLEPREILALVGESGSGKSMTALAIARLLPPRARSTGSIRLGGRELASLPEAELSRIRGRDIGFIFQEPMSALNPVLTIGRQIGETFALHEERRRGGQGEKTSALLDRVGLMPGRDYMRRYAHELSGGQRQRVAIAMAIALSPKLLIADEPTTALDASTQEQILALLKRLVRESGSALVLITHDLGVVADMADRLAIMRNGMLIETGLTGAVLRDSAHPYTRALMHANEYRVSRPDRASDCGSGVLEAQGLVREYSQPRRHMFARPASVPALRGISFSLRRGESVGIVGESGSGKSTLLRSVLALEPLSAGDVRIGGESFTGARGERARALRRSIQAVFQDPVSSFDPRWTVAQSVAESSILLTPQPSARARDERVLGLLERVGLSANHAQRYAYQLSGGQRQRVAIARALMVKPAIIAFDEAFSALDVTTRNKILDLLGQLAADEKIAYLFVSHDLATVRAITDRVLVMRRGRIIEEGATEALFAAPRHAYTAELVAAATRLKRALAPHTRHGQ